MNIVKNALKWRRIVRHRLRAKLTGKTYLNDLFEMKEFNAALANGHIRRQWHPFEDLAIVYYTETAAFDRIWNDATLNCRGLIYNEHTHEVVARPFPKFFNHNQPEAPVISLDEPVAISDKMDGSLGILYQLSSGAWRIATKGSFTSDQALHASTTLYDKYLGWEPVEGFTYLFEIVYPENRIVCDYGDMDDLVLLGAVEINTGLIFGPDASDWPGPRAEVFTAKTYAEALAMPPRKGKEGVVVRTLDDDRMVKIKQADYIALHRIVTGLNARAVWQLMMDGKSLEECIDGVPDELHGWVREVYEYIEDDVNETVGIAQRAFDLIKKQSVEDAEVFGHPRKAFAMLAKSHNLKGYLFRLYDGQDIRDEVLKNAKPAGDWTPVRALSEETA